MACSITERIEKNNWHKAKPFIVMVIIFVMSLIYISGCGGELTSDPVESEEKVFDEEKAYDGIFKFSGEAVVGIEGSDIIVDFTITDDLERGNYTDIVISENMVDIEGNIFEPGIYEFKFVEFPEEQGYGAWYVYINDEIRISGNPKASDEGKEYVLKEGDIISVEFWTIATFYRVAH